VNRILKARIIEHFGSQFDFAHALGIHEAMVSKIVRNRLRLSEEERRRWARVLKDDPDRLFPVEA